MLLRVALLTVGAALAVTGVALVSIPVALVLAGASCAAGGLLWPTTEKGGNR